VTDKTMTLKECILECVNTKGFVEEFDRLHGFHLADMGDKRSPIERMIDKACNHKEKLSAEKLHELDTFCLFVFQYVWLTAKAESVKRFEAQEIVK